MNPVWASNVWIVHYRAISASSFVCNNSIRLDFRRVFIAKNGRLKNVFRIPVHVAPESDPERRCHLISFQYKVKSFTGSHD